MKNKKNIYNAVMKVFSIISFITSTFGITDVSAQRNLFDNFEQRTKAIGKFAHYSNTSGAYRSGVIPTGPCFKCADEYNHADGFFAADQWRRFGNTIAKHDEQYDERSIVVLRQTVVELSRQIETLRKEMDDIRSVLIIDSKLSSKQMLLLQ